MKFIIARDGSGDFTSLQAAVDACAAYTDERITLFLRSGVWEERVVIHRSGITLTGEDRKSTVITGRGCAMDKDENGKDRGTFLSSTLLVCADDVTIENLTIRNDAGDGREVGQAVALYAAGDRGIFRNLDLIAHQDTVFCGPLMPKVQAFFGYTGNAECVEGVGNCPPTHSRELFENCFIQGDIDFIFGPYRCLFDRCTLFMNARGGYYTAANTPESQEMGLVFRDCVLTGECGAGEASLGRPWRKFARTVFLRCSMDEHVSPRGFSDWDEERQITSRYAEFGTTGARADLSARDPREKRLSAEEAEAIEKAFSPFF